MFTLMLLIPLPLYARGGHWGKVGLVTMDPAVMVDLAMEDFITAILVMDISDTLITGIIMDTDLQGKWIPGHWIE
jgi:hypothetical protein